MVNQKRYIQVDHRVRKEIKDELGTSYPSIRMALDFTRNTDLSERIRELALKKGGDEFKIVEE